MRRREKIVDCLMNLVDKAGKDGNFVFSDRLVAEICLKFSCGERLIGEILKQLDLIEKIEIIGNEIWTPKGIQTREIMEKDASLREQGGAD